MNLQVADVTGLEFRVGDDGRVDPRIDVNGIVIPGSRYVPARQFPGTP